MLIDCFPYFNEKELLELRIEVLKDHVDGFLIADANFTHRGEPKEFSAVKTLQELGLDQDKVQVLHVELPGCGETLDPWVRERSQRDALGVGLQMLPDDTVFICSDCDEIVNPDKLNEIIEEASKESTSVIHLSMSMHYGRADKELVSPEGLPFDWRNAFVSTVGRFKKDSTLSSMRASQNNIYLGSRDMGWHFSWMGDSERRLTKLKAYAHWETDTPVVETICKNFEPTVGSKDMLGREDHLISDYPLEKLPQQIFSLPRVQKYLLP